ncbi:glycosyltransferase family 2 protein [Shewanella youngdeokensis]|uniref:Glycosyltransferase family 2 protein n=1 Tax=Shewanella youngdeokensis TaxID=2999068 RepID=A0ABZ0JXA8_9GAMM|nr:glycosyltransferase family 2 protein [Shewanella sp. DAU334]
MKVALLITTYNWIEALKKCLDSVREQTLMPDEIVIADDGSSEDTKQFIDSYRQYFSCPLIHSWQEDKGFRAARSRNKAISKLTADYVVIIDGDIILHRNFIADHVLKAKDNQFISGRRVRLGEEYSKELAATNDYVTPNVFSTGIYRGREHGIRSALLSKISSSVSYDSSSIHSCNMSFWRKDLIKVNGFNADFIGWGAEDKELCERLFACGIKSNKLKFLAVQYHLHHPESDRHLMQVNADIHEATKKNKLKRCENGLNEFIG